MRKHLPTQHFHSDLCIPTVDSVVVVSKTGVLLLVVSLIQAVVCVFGPYSVRGEGQKPHPSHPARSSCSARISCNQKRLDGSGYTNREHVSYWLLVRDGCVSSRRTLTCSWQLGFCCACMAHSSVWNQFWPGSTRYQSNGRPGSVHRAVILARLFVGCDG